MAYPIDDDAAAREYRSGFAGPGAGAGRRADLVTPDEIGFALMETVPLCPLPAVGRWIAHPKSHQPSTLPGVRFCRFHEDAAKAIAKRERPEDHHLIRDQYAEGQDRLRCDIPAVYQPRVAEQDGARLAGYVEQLRNALLRITNLTTTAGGTVAVVGNEADVLAALRQAADDAAEEIRVVESRIDARARSDAP